jgi:hypothetical protein
MELAINIDESKITRASPGRATVHSCWDDDRPKRARGHPRPDGIVPEIRRGCGGSRLAVCCYMNTTSFWSIDAPFMKTMTSCEEPPS